MVPESSTKRRTRSPNYPGIDLGTAVERANALWEHEQHHPVPYEVALRHWGYQPKSGGGGVAHAALKRFGLLEAVGTGQSRLTQLALDIIRGERDGVRDYASIRKAALRPKVHAELWRRYGATLPSDETLAFSLIGDMGFTKGGASEFIAEWKRTLKFADLANASASLSPDEPDSEPTADSVSAAATVAPVAGAQSQGLATAPPRPAASAAGVQAVQVPYAPGQWAVVQAAFPVTESEWQQMLAVLAAMKPGLVADPVPGDD